MSHAVAQLSPSMQGSEKPVFLFAPGNGDTYAGDTTYGSYEPVMEALATDFSPEFVQPDWSEGPDAWTQAVVDAASEHGQDTIYVGGFSFGAWAALLAADRLNEMGGRGPAVGGVMLASLSPYSKEIAALRNPSLESRLGSYIWGWTAKNWSVPVLPQPVQLLAGSKESAAVGMQTSLASGVLLRSHIILVAEAFHNIRSPEYVAAIGANAGALALGRASREPNPASRYEFFSTLDD
ncbi:MAG TPA: hypothetical protein VLH38_02800 [Patescibacteria group bacterium]|nr:hypothetical protein [Patescibacteria group bacterium]